ncbi:hypothetical protein [Flammeovirga sp. SJP92]|uniref:hypothetical protein n=1 Tax=Flammeovirga sp. SJP92 TaxID=1775430 RepID=UPI0007890FC4|nr:hypothetical protein [Flammeovirga sp. SJP92]KXX72730.1 hypothetical protein AVL50_32030 [Flammeovirga sp. SJP92]
MTNETQPPKNKKQESITGPFNQLRKNILESTSVYNDILRRKEDKETLKSQHVSLLQNMASMLLYNSFFLSPEKRKLGAISKNGNCYLKLDLHPTFFCQKLTKLASETIVNDHLDFEKFENVKFQKRGKSDVDRIKRQEERLVKAGYILVEKDQKNENLRVFINIKIFFKIM